jgi:hypothetical protein
MLVAASRCSCWVQGWEWRAPSPTLPGAVLGDSRDERAQRFPFEQHVREHAMPA